MQAEWHEITHVLHLRLRKAEALGWAMLLWAQVSENYQPHDESTLNSLTLAYSQSTIRTKPPHPTSSTGTTGSALARVMDRVSTFRPGKIQLHKASFQASSPLAEVGANLLRAKD